MGKRMEKIMDLGVTQGCIGMMENQIEKKRIYVGDHRG